MFCRFAIEIIQQHVMMMNVIKTIFLFCLCLFGFSIQAQTINEDIFEYDENIIQAKKKAYSNLSEAIGYAEAARQIAYNLKDSALIFKSDLLLGSLYGLKGNYDSALEFYIEADLYKDTNVAEAIAEYDMHMGAIYWSLRENRKAMNYAQSALSLYENLKDTVNIAVLLNLKGLIEIEQKNYVDATLLIDSALYLNRKINNLDGAMDNLNNISLIPGDEDRKIGYLKEVIRNNEKDSLFWVLSENYNNLAAVYLNKGKLDLAKQSMQKANEMAKKSNSERLQIDNLELASQIAFSEGLYKEAYNFLHEKELLQESSLAKNRLERIEEELEVKKKLKQQAIIERQTLILDQQKKEKRLTVTFVSVLFIITIIFIAFYYRRQLDIHRLEQEMTLKNKQLVEQELIRKKDEISSQQEQITMHNNELIDLIYYIKSKDKLVDKVQAMIKEVYKIATSETQNQLKMITVFIKQHRDKEKKINLFTDHLDTVESRFYEVLETKHPNLTKNEKVLAAYLRIGLSTKEIAFLIDSNPKTVNMARYRLRKNLNLETDDNLVDYFATILD